MERFKIRVALSVVASLDLAQMVRNRIAFEQVTPRYAELATFDKSALADLLVNCGRYVFMRDSITGVDLPAGFRIDGFTAGNMVAVCCDFKTALELSEREKYRREGTRNPEPQE